jgi:hypothetical protein
MKKVTDLFLQLDLVGTKIELYHNKSPMIKSYFGSLFTIAILSFCNYAVFYFGSDLYYKEKPISYFSKQFNEESKVYLKNYPIKLLLASQMGTVSDFSKYLDIQAYNYKIGIPGQSVFVTDYLDVEKCKNEFFPSEEILSKLNTSLSSSYCINPFRYRKKNGTYVNEDVYFKNELNTLNAASITVVLDYCKNTTANGNMCLPMDQQQKMIDGMVIKVETVVTILISMIMIIPVR